MVGAQHAARLPLIASRSAADRPSPGTVSVIVRSFKAAVTRELRLKGLWNDQPFWQKNFHDRVIRDKDELERIRAYIANNPVAWQFDQENPAHVSDSDYVARWNWLENAEQ
jgi:hypothetical protein